MTNTLDLNYMTSTDLGDFIPELWDRQVRQDRIQREFFTRFEGKEGSQSAVIAKNNLRKEAGDTIHMETISELYAAPKTGENVLAGYEEEFTDHQFDLTIDLVRHAVSVTRKANKLAFIKAIERAAPMLGRYFAKYFDEVIFALMINSNVATMGTAQASLSSTDRITPDILDALKLGLKRRGALPIEAQVDKYGNVIEFYGCILDEVSAYHLQTNSTFRQQIRDAMPRGSDNPIFTGALGMVDGMILYSYNGIHQGCHQGTPQRPECALSTACSATDTTLTVGSVTGRDYTKHFPATGTLTILADGTNATEEFTYSSKTVNTFVATADQAAADHLVGTRIVQQNYMSTIIGFGAEAIARAFTERDVAIPEERDYKMQLGIALESITGTARIEDSSGNVPNILNYRVYSDPPNLTSITL